MGGGCLYDLSTQHDPRRASTLAWRIRTGDNGLLGALESVDLLFEWPLSVFAHSDRDEHGDPFKWIARVPSDASGRSRAASGCSDKRALTGLPAPAIGEVYDVTGPR